MLEYRKWFNFRNFDKYLNRIVVKIIIKNIRVINLIDKIIIIREIIHIIIKGIIGINWLIIKRIISS